MTFKVKHLNWKWHQRKQMKGKDQKTVYTKSQEKEQHQEKDKVNMLQQQIKQKKHPIPIGKKRPNTLKTKRYVIEPTC